jgi:hypothetical protein
MSLLRRQDEVEAGFSRRALAWVAGSAVISFAAALLLAAFGHELERGDESFANSYSFSALGHRGLSELLRAEGIGVASRRSPGGGRVDETHPLVLAEPDPGWLRGAGGLRLRSLRQEASEAEAPVLLVLPKWRPGKVAKAHREWLTSVSLLPEPETLGALTPLGGDDFKEVSVSRFAAGEPLRCSAAFGEGGGNGSAAVTVLAPELDPVQLLVPRAPLESVVSCPGGALVARLATDDGLEIFVVADPDLINNQGLRRGDNAALILGLLGSRLGARGVVFDETIHGFAAKRGLLAEALRFPMVLAVVQGLLILALVLWAGMGRFGKPQPRGGGPLAGKRVLIDNTAALLAQGDGAADSVGRYFRQTARAVADHFFLAPDLGERELLAQLQKLTQSRGSTLDLNRIESELRALPPEKRKADGRAVAFARRLYAWRLEMMRVERKSP